MQTKSAADRVGLGDANYVDGLVRRVAFINFASSDRASRPVYSTVKQTEPRHSTLSQPHERAWTERRGEKVERRRFALYVLPTHDLRLDTHLSRRRASIHDDR